MTISNEGDPTDPATWKKDFERYGEARLRRQLDYPKSKFWIDANGKVIQGKLEAAWKWLDERSSAQERRRDLLNWAAFGIGILALIVGILALIVSYFAWRRPVSPPG